MDHSNESIINSISKNSLISAKGKKITQNYTLIKEEIIKNVKKTKKMIVKV